MKMSNAMLALDETTSAYDVWMPAPRQSGQNSYVIVCATPAASISTKELFRTLSEKWKAETSHISLVTQRISHPEYLKILSMGKTVVPYILEELEHDIEHWFHALTLLTGENPIPRDFRGTTEEAAQLWIRWGREHYAD
jgi:hypothetical protein